MLRLTCCQSTAFSLRLSGSKRTRYYFLDTTSSILDTRYSILDIAILNGSIMKQAKFGSPNRLSTKKGQREKVGAYKPLHHPGLTPGLKEQKPFVLNLVRKAVIKEELCCPRLGVSPRIIGSAFSVWRNNFVCQECGLNTNDFESLYSIAILNHLCSTRRIHTSFRANALYSFSPGL